MNTEHPNTEFFRSLIDYAGLFPPAALPLDEALSNYSRYQNGGDSEQLSHFVLPVSKFDSVDAELAGLFSSATPLSLSILTSNLVDDLPAIEGFIESGGGAFVPGAVEAKFDLEQNFLSQLQAECAAHRKLPAHCMSFYEIPACPNWEERLSEAISALDAQRKGADVSVGFKLRCGGLTPEMIPSEEQVATVLLKCAEAAVPMKFTAGLHHPFRHRFSKLDCMFHGYMNLFFAGILVFAGERSFEVVKSLIAETDGSTLTLSDKILSWKGFEISAEQIHAARTESVISFGSCSFEEPIEDAKKYGWL